MSELQHRICKWCGEMIWWSTTKRFVLKLKGPDLEDKAMCRRKDKPLSK